MPPGKQLQPLTTCRLPPAAGRCALLSLLTLRPALPCAQASEGCETARNIDGYCEKCAAGYRLTGQGYSCERCEQAECAACPRTAGVCTACADAGPDGAYVLVKGKCLSCGKHCLQCDEPEECIECEGETKRRAAVEAAAAPSPALRTQPPAAVHPSAPNPSPPAEGYALVKGLCIDRPASKEPAVACGSTCATCAADDPQACTLCNSPGVYVDSLLQGAGGNCTALSLVSKCREVDPTDNRSCLR